MKRTNRLLSGILLLPIVLPGFALAQDANLPTEDQADVAVQPEAIEALDRMAAHLRTLTRFRLGADFTLDEVTEDGQKIQTAGTSTYYVRTPDRMRLETSSDKQARIYFYDGKTVTQYSPALDLYSVFEAPATISEMLDAADEKYGVQLPLADLFYWGTERSNVKEIASAFFVGESPIAGDTCNHYAYRGPDADFQVWIRKNGDPLPCRLVITTTDEEGWPEYEATLRWDVDPLLGEGMFSFAPPAGVTKIDQESVEDGEQGG